VVGGRQWWPSLRSRRPEDADRTALFPTGGSSAEHGEAVRPGTGSPDAGATTPAAEPISPWSATRDGRTLLAPVRSGDRAEPWGGEALGGLVADDDRAFAGGPTASPPLIFTVGTASRRGSRASNEDAWLTQPQLLGVADGVGGRPMGRAASKSALTAVVNALEVPGTTLVRAVQKANELVWQEGSADARRRRASTLDVVELDRWGDMSGVHVGDSRVLWVSADGGTVVSLTTDHSHDNRLTQAIGGDDPGLQPDVWVQPVTAGDRVVVATDGLWSRMPPRMVETLVQASMHLTPADTATLLAETAVRYGSTDNVTVVVGQITAAG